MAFPINPPLLGEEARRALDPYAPSVSLRDAVDKVLTPDTANRKDSTNPKDAIGAKKVPLSLIPMVWKAEQSLAYLEGKLKYGEVNWRATNVRASVYLDAAARHLEKFTEGEDRDILSNVHHLANAAACFGIIIDANIYGALIDDRKMSSPGAVLHMDALSEVVQHLDELHKDKSPRHYKRDDVPPSKQEKGHE